MASPQLPIDALPAWALLNSVEFTDVQVQHIDGKGYGLVANKDILGSNDDAENIQAVLIVPHDLILSAEAVEEYAKVDQNFRQLLEIAGHNSPKGDIMLYLLTHIVLSKRNQATPRGCASTSWTEYIKFIPRHIPLPTMWSEDERELLRGTSLEPALKAKLSVLASEFDDLREKSSELQFWQVLFWEHETASLDDWILADAMYRSRCLELPQSGEAMVPALDMANHSYNPTAYYNEDGNGNVVLLMRQGYDTKLGSEITISYGDEKTAAEMLFSYGFIDEDHAVRGLTLPLAPVPDDPLGKAKLHIFWGPPVLRLWRSGDVFEWDSPFVYLMCLNEEDGLDFRLMQDTSGGQELKLFWQEEDVTDQTRNFEQLIQNHPLHQVFKLRVVVVLLERVSTQLERISSTDPIKEREGQEPPPAAGQLKAECIRAAEALRNVEMSLLKGIAEAFEIERAKLLTDAKVVAYLGLMEDSQNDQASTQTASNEDDDFS